MRWGKCCLVAAMLMSGTQVQGQTVKLDSQTDVGLTIYNSNLSLIRDVRAIELSGKSQQLAIEDVSAQIKPETLMFRVKQGEPLTVLEQNFDFDLLTPESLLQKYVGEKVTLVKETAVSADPVVKKGRLLSVAGSGKLVFEIDTPGGKRQIEITSSNNPWRLVMDTVPEHLRQRPTLSLMLSKAKPGKRSVELAYLSSGLSWKADYVAMLNKKETRIDLIANVTLTNTSGTTYQNADLQLVAGDVHQVQPQMRKMMRGMVDAELAGAPEMREEGLMDYHLYTLPRKTTIANKQTKQVLMFQREDVVVGKQYMADNRRYQYSYSQSVGDVWTDTPVAVLLKMKNNKPSNLGLPLPQGIVRVYQPDSKGAIQFVGEDRINHTPKDEEVSLKLGSAFDVKAKRRQVSFERHRSPYSSSRYIYTSEYEIKLHNAKEDPVTVRVLEPVASGWKMIEESQKSRRENASTISWDVSLAANEEKSIRYTVRSE